MKKFFVFICCIITVATFLLAGCGPDTGSDSDTPVLKNFKCRGSAAVGSGSVIESVRAFSSSVEMYNFEIQPDSYFVAKEKIVLEITIENPEGYSISRFKINGTAFTSGSFTTLPIVIGSLDTVINVEVTLPSETVTYNLSDIKYIAERNVSGNNSGEKSVTMPEQLKSITVNVLEDRIYSTNGVVYQIVGDGIYVYGHKLMLGRGYWTGASSSNKREKISLTVPENIEGINVTYVCFTNNFHIVELDLPSTTQTVFLYVVLMPGSKLTIRAAVPPAIADMGHFQIHSEHIYVPAESVEAYKAAPGWSEYSSRISAIA